MDSQKAAGVLQRQKVGRRWGSPGGPFPARHMYTVLCLILSLWKRDDLDIIPTKIESKTLITLDK